MKVSVIMLVLASCFCADVRQASARSPACQSALDQMTANLAELSKVSDRMQKARDYTDQCPHTKSLGRLLVTRLALTTDAFNKCFKEMSAGQVDILARMADKTKAGIDENRKTVAENCK